MLSLNDTRALVQAVALNERTPSSAESGFNSAAVTAWAQPGLDQETFDGYLHGQRLTRDGLAALLSGGSWSPKQSSVTWLAHVSEWLVDPAFEASYAPGSRPLVIENTSLNGLPFPGLLASIVAAQAGLLSRWPWLQDSARSDLLDRLAERLATLAMRCLLTELAQDPTDGAYERLNAALSRPDARLAFFTRYPVLSKDLVVSIGHWRAQIERILTRLTTDAAALSNAGLLPCDVGTLRSIELSSGDSHDQGQSVAILRFADGHRIVYKPRDGSIFAFYGDVLGTLEPALPKESRLYAPEALVRAGYAWVEHIEHASEGRTDPSAYLRKVGALLAIAHVFGASDLHLENVIASASGPVPIDLETLIQNRSRTGNDSVAAVRAGQWLNESVLGTGILPVQLTAGEGTSIDVSVSTGGLQEHAGHATAHQITAPFTDQMRIQAVEVPIGRARNQPPGMTLALVRSHRTALVRGFAETYHAVLSRRTQVRELLTAAPNFTVRHIARATRSYSLLLTELRQPSRLRSGIDRDHLLRSLWVRLADSPDQLELIRAEELAIRRLDIPLFTTTLDSDGLHTDGETVAPGYFTQTTRDDALHRLDGLSEAGISESLRLIDESILAATPPQETREAPAREIAPPPPRSSGDADLHRAAHEQAQILVDSAIHGHDDVTWISVCSSTDSTALEYRPIGPTLYDGLAGIMFSATYAHNVLPDLGLDDLAHRTARAIASILDDWSHARVTLPVGAFSGASGLLYALTHYDSQLGENQHQTLRTEAIRRLTTVATDDTYFDVMAGAAGACAVVAALPESHTDDGRTALRALATHLIKHSVDAERGSLAWETGTARARLGGFSHGATGIGWALAKAASILDDKAVAAAAHRALRFDDTLFDQRRRRWLDARPESAAQGGAFPAHWCHGTAGIAMARAASATLLGEPDLFELTVHGAQETTHDRLPSDDSLCHGTLGNLLAMREVARHNLSNIGIDEYRDRIAERLHDSTPRSGLPQGVTTVRGLMLGTAGTLYALCSETQPSFPNVLLLDGPPIPATDE